MLIVRPVISGGESRPLQHKQKQPFKCDFILTPLFQLNSVSNICTARLDQVK